MIRIALTISTLVIGAQAQEFTFKDPKPQRYLLKERASVIDPRIKAYPKIGFLIEKDGKPQDLQHAAVDTSVAPRGKLVIWMMAHNPVLFERVNSYGLHIIQPHYARHWFGLVCQEKPVGEQSRGNMRLEAATGEDFSDEVDLAKPDGMKERAFQFVKWLDKNNPQGNWGYFLTKDGKGLRWEHVIMAGASHGSTTSARFAKHQKVSRVVMLCGPRDQFQTWQSLPSATPENRFFGFSHTLDGGWKADHYCRSWELMSLHYFGPIVDVDKMAPPYGSTRRLITSFDVGGNANKAHSAVQPGKASLKKDGKYAHDAVWRYMFTHPVDLIGKKTPLDEGCNKDQR